MAALNTAISHREIIAPIMITTMLGKNARAKKSIAMPKMRMNWAKGYEINAVSAAKIYRRNHFLEISAPNSHGNTPSPITSK